MKWNWLGGRRYAIPSCKYSCTSLHSVLSVAKFLMSPCLFVIPICDPLPDPDAGLRVCSGVLSCSVFGSEPELAHICVTASSSTFVSPADWRGCIHWLQLSFRCQWRWDRDETGDRAWPPLHSPQSQGTLCSRPRDPIPAPWEGCLMTISQASWLSLQPKPLGCSTCTWSHSSELALRWRLNPAFTSTTENRAESEMSLKPLLLSFS